MKTYKRLYPQIYNFTNLYLAFRQARRGKRSRADVAALEFDIERNLLQLRTDQRLPAPARGATMSTPIRTPATRCGCW